MKILSLGRLAVLSCLIVVSSFGAESLAVAFRSLSLPDALQAAATEKKLVLVDLYTTWCGPCKMLDQTTWKDPAVAALIEAHAVPLKLDAEKEAEISRKYRITAYPTLLILRPDGTEFDRMIGYRDAADFTTTFTNILAGKSTEKIAREAVAKAAEDEHANVQARYNLGRTLSQEGKYPEALAEYLWCFDVGMVNVPSFTGVRLSFLLSSIAQLGRQYPAALDELITRRDAAQALLESGPENWKAGLDYAALSTALGDKASVLDEWAKFPKGDRRRAILGSEVIADLVKKRRYDDALEARPLVSMTRLFDVMSRLPSQGKNAQMQQIRERSLVSMMTVNIEVLVGAGHLPDAKELARRLVAFSPTPETQAGIAAAAARAGHPDFWPVSAPAPAAGPTAAPTTP